MANIELGIDVEMLVQKYIYSLTFSSSAKVTRASETWSFGRPVFSGFLRFH